MHIDSLARPVRNEILAPPYRPTIPGMLEYIAATYGETDAVVRSGDRMTFQQLEQDSAELAQGMLAWGLGKSSRVALLMPNSTHFLVTFMAAARIGAVVLPMSTLYQPRELAWVLNHADIDTLFMSRSYLGHDYVERIEQAFPEIIGQQPGQLYLSQAPHLRRIAVEAEAVPGWSVHGNRSIIEMKASLPRIDRDYLASIESSVTPADPLCMLYTSGSTADPKGVVHLHGSMMRHAWQLSHDYYPYGREDRLVVARPWFWVAGLSSSLLFTLARGVCLIVPETESAEEAVQLIEDENANFFGVSPVYFNRINRYFEQQKIDYRVFQISTGIGALAKLDRSSGEYRFLSDHIESLAPACLMPIDTRRIPSSYGQTETLATNSCERPPTLMPESKAVASGRPVPGVQRKIVDPITRKELPPGDIGELYVRGYSLMAGLYKKERHEVFDEDGYYPSGDACSIDEDDCLKFSARLSEMIKISGANVAPLEVEQVLLSYDEIENCAVFELPNEKESILAAVVVLTTGFALDVETLSRRLKSELSSFKVPRRIFFMNDNELPKTATGKIRKIDLAKMLGDRE